MALEDNVARANTQMIAHPVDVPVGIAKRQKAVPPVIANKALDKAFINE